MIGTVTFSGRTEAQKCPRCGGQGTTNRPPWVAGDQPFWTDSNAGPHPCPTCAGNGVLLVVQSSEVTS